MLTNMAHLRTLEVREGRILCPVCGNKTDQVVLPSTIAVDLPVFCKRCKQQTLVTIEHGKCQCQSASA